MTWEKAATIEQLRQKPTVFKKAHRQIALFLVDGKSYAVDNRCPHEGYPLADGTVSDGCLLTCNWHNWKFRLQDGECVIGGDNVRTYPAKVDDGCVWVNLADPPKEEVQAEVLRGLRTAFDKRDFGRISREIARLHFNQIDPLLAIEKALEWSFDRLEFGTTHAYAAAADWIAQSLRYQSPDELEKKLVCLTEAVDHIADDVLRQETYPYPETGEPFTRASFKEAVEREEYQRAEGMTLRGLEDGLHWSDMEPAFARAALDHYNDFGHCLIYVYKTTQLLGILGERCERFLLLPLARDLCYATREDLIPEFKCYRLIFDSMPLAPGNANIDLDTESLHHANIEQACRWVAERFERSDPLRMYDVLLQELAWNMLHFDARFGEAYDRPVSQNVGWLDFTHGITFANAVRVVCGKYPELWRAGLLQIACFLGRNRSFVDSDIDESQWLVEDETAFWQETEGAMLDHGFRVPIFSAHAIKTARAVEEEVQFASPRCRKYLLASLYRFLHSPIKQKHPRRLARQAIALVSRDFE